MKLEDKITFYERESVSDGAGGQTPGVLTEVTWCWGNVKAMTGFIGMQFQQLTGSQGYEILIRTDFDRQIDRKHIIRFESIYGDVYMTIHSVDAGKYYTKLTCKAENKLITSVT